MTGNTRQQVRAAFLAVVMVVSVFGMTVGLAGTAAADVTSSSFGSDTTVQGGEQVTISGTVNNDSEDAIVYVDVDDNGSFDSGEAFARVDAADLELESGTDTFELNITAPSESGVENPDATQVYVEQEDPLSEGDDYANADESVGGLTIDDTAPGINTTGGQTPADGAIVNDETQTITVPVGDERTGVDHITVSVDDNGDINTYEINPDAAGSDGVSYSDGDVVVEPGTGDVPALEDGPVSVTVSATDNVGNQDSGSFGFEVDIAGVWSTFEAPGTTQHLLDADVDALTNDENQTVEVSLVPGDSVINDSTAELDIAGPSGGNYAGGASFDYTDDVYSNDSDTFGVDPASSDDIDAFDVDGEYDVTVSGASEAGATHTRTYTLDVDTAGPESTGFEKSDNLTSTVTLDEVDWNSEHVDMTFNESVDDETVEAEVIVDGQVVETLDVFHYDGQQLDEVRAYLDLSLAGYHGVEDDAVINITAAEDRAGNDLLNPDAEASNTTFAVDTDAPSVELGAMPNDGELGGYVNMSSFVADTDDVESYEFNVRLGEVPQDRSTHTIGDYSAAETVDTTRFPDGPHLLQVIVQDANGNTDEAVASFSLDNHDDGLITVQPYFLAGDTHAAFDDVEPAAVGQDLDLSEHVFDSVDDENTTYRVAGVETSEFDVEDYGHGDTVTLEAESDHTGETETVDVEVYRLPDVSVDTYDGTDRTSSDPSAIVVTSGFDLSTLDVTVASADDYDDREVTLARSDFTRSGDRYVADVPELRDGSWNVQVDEFGTGFQSSGSGASTSFTLDNEDPVLTDATVSGADSDGRTQLALDFNEPVAVNQPPAIDGDVQVAFAQDGDGSDGTIVVQLDDVLQTGDGADVTFPAGAVDEEVGVDSNPGTMRTVDTVDLQLSEGNNLVSVPAATGRLDVSELDTSNVNAIWAYDDGEWISHVPGADENDLTVLVGGQGYVFNMEADDEIPVRVYNEPGDTGSDAPSVPASEDVENGWNLIGHFQEADQPRDDALSTISDSYSPSMVLGEAGDGSYQAVSTLESGEAYWLFASDEDVYAEQPFTDAPAVFNLEAFDVEGDRTYTNLDAEDGEEVRVHASVNDPDGVDTVTFDSNVDDSVAEMSDDNGDGVYTADVTLDLTEKGGVVTIGDVTATDNAGESGTMGLDAFVNDQDASISGGQTNEPADGFATATTTETTEIEFYAQGVSADGDTDTLTLVVPQNIADQTDLANTVNFVETDNYAIEGGPTIVNVGGGTANGIQFDIAPDSGGDVDVTARVNVDLAYPAGDGTDHSFDAAVLDSDGSSETTTSGIAIVTGDERPALSSAVTSDTDDNGQIDQISVTFSEDVTDVEAADYDVDGYNVVGVNDAGDSDASTFGLVLEESGSGDTGATPTVTYQSDGVNDETVDAEQQGLEVPDGMSETPSDGADVQVMSLTGAGSQSLTLTLSENVGPNSDGSGTFDTSAYTYNDNTGDTESITGVTDDTGSDRTVTINLDDAAETDDSVTLDIAHNADDGSNISSPTTVGIES